MYAGGHLDDKPCSLTDSCYKSIIGTHHGDLVSNLEPTLLVLLIIEHLLVRGQGSNDPRCLHAEYQGECLCGVQTLPTFQGLRLSEITKGI